MSSLTLFVGIDVSKDTLDVAVRPTAEAWQVANAAAEISTLVAQLAAMAPALVVLEATGGFERSLLAAVAVATIPVVRANPRQVRALVAYLGAADNVSRLLPNSLKDVNQPVIRSRNPFSRPHLSRLASL